MGYILNRKKKIAAFFGDLAVGKTTLIKSMISAYFPIDPSTITSPTFTYMNVYPTTPIIYHFDLYRVESEKKIQDLAIFDYFNEGLCMIEWSEKIENLLPKDALKVMIFNLSENERQIEVYDCIENI